MPKISVIVPVYKVEKYLNRCIDSILNQTFIDFELILVDDGSPDNCGKICDEYAEKDSRIVVIHKENGGLSDARNAGLDWIFANSDSEWITFIDSDDYIHLQYLELLLNAAIKNKVLISSCGIERCCGDLNNSYLISEYNTDIGHADSLLHKRYKFDEFNKESACVRLYNKTLWSNIRFPVGRYHEDAFTIYRLLYKCKKIVVILLPLYYYFQNDNSIMHSELTPKRLKDLCDAKYSQIKFFYDNGYYATLNRILNEGIWEYYINLQNFGKNKSYKQVLRWQNNSLRAIIRSYKDHVSQKVYKTFSLRTKIKIKIKGTTFFRSVSKIYRTLFKQKNTR